MNEVVVLRRNGRGGARPGAGRKPGSVTKDRGRFIYVIHEECDPTVCKVGLANNPFSRLIGHQVSTWRALKLASSFILDTPQHASLVEKAAHAALAGLHVRGEWFRCEPATAAEQIIQVSQALGFRIRPTIAETDLKITKMESSG